MPIAVVGVMMSGHENTRYFDEQVLRKRPYIGRQWCAEIITRPVRREVQADGRVRFWDMIARPGEAEPRYLRVVTLADGITRPRFSRGQDMKLHYYADTDSLYIELKETPGTETREVAAGLVVDLDAKGDVVGFDIDGASRRFDLSTLETVALPVKST